MTLLVIWVESTWFQLKEHKTVRVANTNITTLITKKLISFTSNLERLENEKHARVPQQPTKGPNEKSLKRTQTKKLTSSLNKIPT